MAHAPSAPLEQSGLRQFVDAVLPLSDEPTDANVERYVAQSSAVLTACSVCLRVFHGSDWLDAETVIRELRSFDLATPPRLKAALCDRCVRSLRERRGRPARPLAA